MKKQFTLLFGLALILFNIHACKDKDDNPDDAPETFATIELNTAHGSMYIHLYDSTPLHKANFIKLMNEGFFDSTEFHRIIPNFVIQGGDPNSKDDDRNNDGTGGPGYTTPAEIDSANLKHIYGAIGAARLGNGTNPQRNSSGSQFYIVTNPAGTHFLDGEYTVFGEIIGGMDVATTIQSQPRNGNDLPNTRIPMTIKIANLTAQEIQDRGITSPVQ
jgi:cyclophilin family peptidyl-prolyl cis-trans isomerase